MRHFRIIALLLLTGIPLAADDDRPVSEPALTENDYDHWSFRPLERPAVPAIDSLPVAVRDWPRNAIDQLILARLVQEGLAPAPAADRVTLIRRLTFNLTGLPPTPAQIDSFVSDERPDAYERLVERLLNSPDYGQRWAQHWLDLARFAETDGFEHDKIRPDAWKYRDWVIDALNDDMPFDEFVRHQMAADESLNGQRLATGFLTCGPDMPDINLQDERRHSFLNDMTSTVGSVFLGLQMGCAQCHDHKFDPISQLDFYRLRAFFDPGFPQLEKNKTVPLPTSNNRSINSRMMIRGDFRRPGPPVEPAFVRISNARGDKPRIIPDRTNLRSELADWLTRPDHPLTTRTLANRLWQYHFGRGLSETPSDCGLVGDRPAHLTLLNWLATEIPRRGWSLKEMHRLIVTSATYRQASRLSPGADETVIENWKRALQEDPANRLHSRGMRRRLEGEAIRDALLFASNQLSQRRGGPGIRPPLPAELVQTLLRNQWPISQDPADYTRRSIYLFVRRNLRYPLFEAFDKPDTNASCPRRNESTIAPQALMLLNSRLTLDTAKALADSALAIRSGDRDDQVRDLYRRLFGREPDKSEQQLSERFLAGEPPDATVSRDALIDFCLALINANEFVYVD